MMKRSTTGIVLSLFLLPCMGTAQTTHTVNVVGTPGGAMPAYVPADITIDQGDAVEWVCAQGSHNVYAELDSFPDNPAPFNSAPTAQTSPWTYSFTFDIPGLYHYGCNGGTAQMPHWTMQQGTVLVVASNGVEEIEGWGHVSVFPMPANDVLYVDADDASIARYDVLATDGRLLFRGDMAGNTQRTIPLKGLDAGNYLLRLTDTKDRTLVRRFIKY